MAEEEEFLTTPQVAKILKISVRRVRALIEAGRLPSVQFGREHLIKRSDLAAVKHRKPGRPAQKKSTKPPAEKK